jgi:GT2 family glycosyltransferase
MISILIATKDRSKELKACLKSILLSKFRNFEVLVLDQSNNNATEKCVLSLSNKKIKYVKLSFIGKSKAINKGLLLSVGDIITLTDDDCIVDPNWLSAISNYFESHSSVYGLFGRTLPYQPKKHSNLICPATFNRSNEMIVSDPTIIFYQILGQGNNVSYRKRIFTKLGNMNEAFGPGAKIPTAEDGELLYRILINNYKLAYTPNALIYHNRWLTPGENINLQLQYTLGVCACAVYSWRHSHYDKRVLNILYNKLQENIFNKIHFANIRYETVDILKQFTAIIKGVYLGLFVK